MNGNKSLTDQGRESARREIREKTAVQVRAELRSLNTAWSTAMAQTAEPAPAPEPALSDQQKTVKFLEKILERQESADLAQRITIDLRSCEQPAAVMLSDMKKAIATSSRGRVLALLAAESAWCTSHVDMIRDKQLGPVLKEFEALANGFLAPPGEPKEHTELRGRLQRFLLALRSATLDRVAVVAEHLDPKYEPLPGWWSSHPASTEEQRFGRANGTIYEAGK